MFMDENLLFFRWIT